jgi:uncharacterized membrane protein YfcA
MLIVLAVAGLVAGFVNTMAGGGSLLTLPALMLLGLPAEIANGTNRVSVLAQSLSGAWLFHEEGKLDRSALVPVLAPTVSGSLIGAVVASRAPRAILEPALIVTMVVVALLMAFRPKLVTASEDEQPRPVRGRALLGLFAAGLYGGFIQAGVGFVLLSVLGGMLRYDLVRANALKLACTTIFGVVGLTVFVVAAQVEWLPGLALAVATVVGSQLGVRFTLRVDQRLLHRLVLGCVVALTALLLLRR